MQDTKTGEMVPLDGLLQSDFDRAIPDRSRQGCVLSVGEVVEIKGGRFRVKSFGRKFVCLEGLPATHMRKQPPRR